VSARLAPITVRLCGPDVAAQAIFTRSKPLAETSLPLRDVLDLRAEEGKVSGLKLFHTTHHVECVAILEPARKGS
jgi:hypothetical protein